MLIVLVFNSCMIYYCDVHILVLIDMDVQNIYGCRSRWWMDKGKKKSFCLHDVIYDPMKCDKDLNIIYAILTILFYCAMLKKKKLGKIMIIYIEGCNWLSEVKFQPARGQNATLVFSHFKCSIVLSSSMDKAKLPWATSNCLWMWNCW